MTKYKWLGEDVSITEHLGVDGDGDEMVVIYNGVHFDVVPLDAVTYEEEKQWQIGDYVVVEKYDIYLKIMNIKNHHGELQYNFEGNPNEDGYAYYTADAFRKPTSEELNKYYR